MNAELERCLEDLENRIDPEVEDRLLAEWEAFSTGRFTGDIFSPVRAAASRPGVEWPRVSVNEGLADYDRMALQQFGACSSVLAKGVGQVLNVRSNYGSSILPAVFGVEMFIMDEAANTLPTTLPLHDSDAIRRLIDAGAPDLDTGWGAQVFEMGRRYVDIARRYPKIGKYVWIYHPDTQGPMDVAEVVWGSDIFYALYEEPQLVHDFLELVTDTYIAFMRRWMEIVPFRAEANSHWGLYHKGSLTLRQDSAMNLSGEMFDEFIRPRDQRLLDTFGGGIQHYCGRGDHYIPSLCAMPGIRGINLSQPHLNDMETIFASTVDRGIPLLGLRREAAEAALAAGRDLRGRVHCY